MISHVNRPSTDDSRVISNLIFFLKSSTCNINFRTSSATNLHSVCRVKVITKTCLYKFDPPPLQPHFYIVKLGFTGVYIIFLILLNNIDCRYSLEPPRRGGSNEYHNLYFEQKYEKYRRFYLKSFGFLKVKSSIYLNRHVSVMKWTIC